MTQVQGTRGGADLDEALLAARSVYAQARPKSRQIHESAAAVMPGGNTRTVLFHNPFPITVVGGEGCRIRDVDGFEYVNYLGEFTAGLFGHSNPVIRDAIEKALHAGISLSAHNTQEPLLARLLCERFPSLQSVRFTNSGTEANLMALATAIAVTGRRRVLVFKGGYHGSVLHFVRGGSAVNVPHEFVVARYNDVTEVEGIFATQGSQLAAILVEPMLGSGGCIPATRTFLAALRAGATKHGAVLIFDEVQTSRLAPGGLQEALSILPDMTTLGKYLGGGLSFGAFGGRDELMQRYDPRRSDALLHAGTFNNNILTMSAGVAALTHLFTPEVVRRLNERGDRLRARLNDVCTKAAVALRFTGLGSLLTAHLGVTAMPDVDDVARTDPRLKELLFFDLLSQGCYTAPRGMIALSLEIGDAECDLYVAALAAFVDRHGRFLAARTSHTTSP